MKRRLCSFLAALLTFFALAVPAWADGASNKTVHLVTGEWPPFTSQQEPGGGFFTQIVVEVFQSMGYRAEVEYRPWARAAQEVRKGQFFAAFPYRTTPERMAVYDFTDVVVAVRTCFLFDRRRFPDGVPVKTLRDLKEYRVGGTMGDAHIEVLGNAGVPLDVSPTEELSLRKLLEARIDLLPIEINVGRYLLRKHVPEEADFFEHTDLSLNQSGVMLMVSRSYPDAKRLTAMFNKALAAYKKTKRFRELTGVIGREGGEAATPTN